MSQNDNPGGAVAYRYRKLADVPHLLRGKQSSGLPPASPSVEFSTSYAIYILKYRLGSRIFYAQYTKRDTLTGKDCSIKEHDFSHAAGSSRSPT